MRITGESSIQNSESWLELRRSHITASEISCLFDANEYMSKYELYLLKKGLYENKPNANTKFGSDNEGSLIAHLEKEHGLFFLPSVYTSDRFPFLLASLDGIDVEETVIAEVKVVSMEKFHAAKRGEICKAHMLQVQCQMLCVPTVEHVLYHCYNPAARSYVTIVVYPDNEMQGAIVGKAMEFLDMLENNRPPLMLETDIPYESSISELEDLYELALANKKKAEDELEKVKDLIISRANGKECTGSKYHVVKSQRTTFEYKKAVEDAHLDLSSYEKISTSWIIKTLN
jgi:putative phage-type endonuclease